MRISVLERKGEAQPLNRRGHRPTKMSGMNNFIFFRKKFFENIFIATTSFDFCGDKPNAGRSNAVCSYHGEMVGFVRRFICSAWLAWRHRLFSLSEQPRRSEKFYRLLTVAVNYYIFGNT